LQSQQVAFGRVALLGDAAFVARPHMGMGVTKAGDDALALAAAIAAHGATPQALLQYESKRLPASSALVERGRQLGAYLQSYPNISQEPKPGSTQGRQAAVVDRPYDVMRQTAIDSQDTEALRFTSTRTELLLQL
jgi:2-polyprenyl-6-methoxyphenol hydroxylase-like FAD-dependent oxidoreductase